MINFQDRQASVEKHVKKHQYTATVILDKKGEIAKKFHITGIPTTLVIDKAGKIAFRASKPVEWKSAEMQALITELLSESYQ